MRQQTKNILIVDDEPKIRNIIQRRLKDEGFACLQAENGKRAVEVLRANPQIEVVILDILLPQSSGLEVYDVIRKEFPRAKVIVCSVHETDEQAFFINDADAYYYKSESVDTLIGRINSLIKKEALHESGKTPF